MWVTTIRAGYRWRGEAWLTLRLVGFGSSATATFKSRGGQWESIKMKGDFLSTSAEMVDEATGTLLARVERNLLNWRDIVIDKQTYALTVAPGVDMALMAALCICLDEKRDMSRAI